MNKTRSAPAAITFQRVMEICKQRHAVSQVRYEVELEAQSTHQEQAKEVLEESGIDSHSFPITWTLRRGKFPGRNTDISSKGPILRTSRMSAGLEGRMAWTRGREGPCRKRQGQIMGTNVRDQRMDECTQTWGEGYNFHQG